ncbi:MAG TPA: carbonic anhydrase [Gaiellaceae bacterium]|nr:carbonic anhydrase [Gaiellaceae bacterium]
MRTGPTRAAIISVQPDVTDHYSSDPPVTPAEALTRLMAGNARFVRGQLTSPNAIAERRQDVAGAQKPFAILLTCADSRVPPEHVFDQSLGHLFVCRVAGNVLESRIVGSIEYAVANFHSPLVMVLGHQHCGAVRDTIALLDKGQKAPGSIQAVVDAIAPVVRRTPRGSLDPEAYVEQVVRANARAVATQLARSSAIVREAVAAGELRVVAAEYSLASGRVTLLS